MCRQKAGLNVGVWSFCFCSCFCCPMFVGSMFLIKTHIVAFSVCVICSWFFTLCWSITSFCGHFFCLAFYCSLVLLFKLFLVLVWIISCCLVHVFTCKTNSFLWQNNSRFLRFSTSCISTIVRPISLALCGALMVKCPASDWYSQLDIQLKFRIIQFAWCHSSFEPNLQFGGESFKTNNSKLLLQGFFFGQRPIIFSYCSLAFLWATFGPFFWSLLAALGRFFPFFGPSSGHLSGVIFGPFFPSGPFTGVFHFC